jgi:hypothetical protein
MHWLEYGADYAVSAPSKDDTGGTLTLLTEIPDEATDILIRRHTPVTQEIDLHDNTRLHAETIERIADKTAMEVQEIKNLTNETILTEEAQREEADTALGERISTEEAQREEADAALGERISTEEAQRKEADTALGERISTEEAQREEAETALGDAIAQEVIDRDAAIEKAELANQEWLEPVEKKADLPDPATLDPTITYLCRVRNDNDMSKYSGVRNNGVWQLVAGGSEWVLYFNDDGFTSYKEFRAAMEFEVKARNAAVAGVTARLDNVTYVPVFKE